MRGGRHHRRHLLARERVVVADYARRLRRQVLAEELELVAERTMQPHLAVCAPAELHPLLERLLLRGRDSDRERRAQQRRPARGLQVREQVARLLGALVSLVARALLPVGLGLKDLVGVLNAAAREAQRELVGQVTRAQGEIDSRGKRFGGREHELQPRPRKARPFWQRAGHQVRLPAHPELRLDSQRAPAVLEVAVRPAHHVSFERCKQRFAARLEHERARLVEAVHDGLPEAAAERPPHEPLDLRGARRSDLDEAREPRVHAVGTRANALELPGRQQPAVESQNGAAKRREGAAGPLLECAGHERGDIRLGIAQAHEDEDLRAPRGAQAEVARVSVEVSPRQLAMRSLGFTREALGIPRGAPAASDAQDLNIRLHGFERTEERREADALLSVREGVVGVRARHERRPRIAGSACEHAVAVHEADRRSHRTLTPGRCPRAREPLARAPAGALAL